MILEFKARWDSGDVTVLGTVTNWRRESDGLFPLRTSDDYALEQVRMVISASPRPMNRLIKSPRSVVWFVPLDMLVILSDPKPSRDAVFGLLHYYGIGTVVHGQPFARPMLSRYNIR